MQAKESLRENCDEVEQRASLLVGYVLYMNIAMTMTFWLVGVFFVAALQSNNKLLEVLKRKWRRRKIKCMHS